MKPESKILGVCSWLAYRYHLSVSGLRWLFVLGAIFGLGSPVLIYIIIWLVKPKE